MKKIFAILFMLTMLFSASALAEEVILPDPGYYFGRSYDGYMIEFDEYPKAEFDAYTTLLINKYGLEITDAHSGKYDEFFFMKIPGVENSKVFVSCFQDSEGVFGMEFDFGKSITLSALEVYTASAECAICGGDAVCDTCGGKGYLEMTAYGSKDTVRVACTGGCTEGKCLACGAGIDLPIPAQDTKTYTPPIVGNDGLIVMSPEQYLEIEPCNQITISDDACYVYHYDKCGREWSGRGSNEKWAMMESYVQALVDSGYYEVSDYEQGSYATIWCIRYIGPAETITGGYDIQVKSYGGRCSVYYRIATVSADDLQEKLIYFNMDDPTPDPDDPSPILETCDVCNGDRKCRYCRGKGTDGITGRDCAVCDRGKCPACGGSGHK